MSGGKYGSPREARPRDRYVAINRRRYDAVYCEVCGLNRDIHVDSHSPRWISGREKSRRANSGVRRR